MEWLNLWRLRLKSLFTRRQLDRDLEDELAFHLAMREKKYRASGAPDAHEASRRHFGNLASLKEACRTLWTFQSLVILGQDLRYALRIFTKNKTLMTVVVLSLGLGIGANTAIFSVVNAIMLRSLPVNNPQQLALVRAEMIHNGQVQRLDGWSYQSYSQFRKQATAFSDLLAAPGTVVHMDDAELGGTNVQLVSDNFFSTLGTKAAAGRTFSAGENDAVAVISYGLWERAFGLDRSIIGRSITVEHTSLTILGVAQRGFSGVDPAMTVDVWAPLNAALQPRLMPRLSNPINYSISVIGRLQPGSSLPRAQAEMEILFQQYLKGMDFSHWPEDGRREFMAARIIVEPAGHGVDSLQRTFGRPLFLLMGIVGLVLLIACANVANLLVSQANVRQPEIITRIALGARRLRIVRQLLTESVLLSFFGGCLGVLFAWWGAPLLLKLMSGRTPVVIDVHPDLRVLAFTVAVSLLTGLLFGLAPALNARNMRPESAIGGRSRTVAGSWTGKRLGKVLVVGQVALSLLLLVGAGLLLGTLHNLQNVAPGFNRSNVLLFSSNATREGYKQQKFLDLYSQLLEQIKQLPGVSSASYSLMTPISGGAWQETTAVEGYVPRPGEDMVCYANSIGPDYFRTLGTPLVMGRPFGPQDTATSARVVIINQTMARRFFGDGNPIGRHLRWPSYKLDFEIVGVAGDAKYRGIRADIPPTMYLNSPQDPWAGLQAYTFEVRSSQNPTTLVPALQTLFKQVDSRLHPTTVKTLSQQVDESLSEERMTATLSSFFGVLALSLAGIGLYGVIFYGVTQRINEIGVRMALGAQRIDVLWMVLRGALTLVAVGIASGLLISIAATRLVATQLYGLTAHDPTTIISASLILVVVAALAAYLPARKAARLNPISALRYE